MMKSALLLLLVLATAQAQLPKVPVCKENETFTTCGTACEPSCDVPNSMGCTFQCVPKCQCNKGFYRRSDRACVTEDQCTVTP
ncbi:unnamed protein product [Caenorhabditis brenneri]